MTTKNVTFRLDETLKKQAETIYNGMGLNMSSALQIFVKQTVVRGAIPFILEADEDAKHKAYILRELAESKSEVLDHHITPEDHDILMSEWDAKRKLQSNV